MGTIRVDASDLIKKMDYLTYKASPKLRSEWWKVTSRIYLETQNRVHTRTGRLKESGESDVTGNGSFVVGTIKYGDGLRNNSGHGYAIFEMHGGGYFVDAPRRVSFDIPFEAQMPQADGWGDWEHTPMQGLGGDHDFMMPVRKVDNHLLYTRAMLKAMRGKGRG